jgi:uncharacterized SAM-binding protein YcdF (DUF218 family)
LTRRIFDPTTAPGWQRVARIVGIVTFVALVLCVLTPLPNLLAKYQSIASNVGPADAIVVLGAGTLFDGSLSDESMRRFIRGMSLFKEKRAPLMVLLGPGRGNVLGRSEADVRAQFAVEFGIPTDALVTISTALTTHEEALATADALQKRRVERILLVTESIHMRRAKLLFEKAGFTVLPVSSDHFFEISVSAQDRLWLVTRLAQETVGLIYYRLAGYI